MSAPLSPAEQHIELLTGNAETPMHFRFIHDSDKSMPAIKRFGTYAALRSEIEALQADGYGAFIGVNDGGDRDQDITAIRAVFADADGVPMPDEWHVQPDFIVQRDATHWHPYWTVTGCPVEQFRAIQKRLAAHYGTDTAVSNPSRVMRLAGTLHLKDPDSPVPVSIRSNVGVWELGHTPGEVQTGLAGDVEGGAESTLPSAAAGQPVDAAALREAVSYLDPDLSYPDWSRNVAAIGAANCPEARDIAHEYSEGALDRLGQFKDARPPRYSGHEAVDAVLDTMPPKEGGVGVGTIEFLAHQAGWAGTLAARPSSAERFAGFLAQNAEEGDAEYPRPMLAGNVVQGDFPATFHIWEGFILAQHVNLLGGDGGSGKTLLDLMIGAAVAAGIPLFGYATVQAPVVLVLAEDDYGATKKRLEAIARTLALNLAELPLYVWCLPGTDVRLASVADDGTWTPGPFMAPLRAMLAEIGKPAVVVLDTVSDIAVLDETKRLAVNTLCKPVLGGLCRDFGATVIVNAHPSKAAMSDGSGYAGSTAWNNAVRNRLTLERPDAKSSKRILRVAKSNYGSNSELELHMVDGVFWLRDQGEAAELNDRLMSACVVAALAAADQGTPVAQHKRPPKWVFDEVERDAGKRPTWPELKEVLDYAQRAGRIRYLKGTSKRMAGYYPWDERRAIDLAVEAKRHAIKVDDLMARATRREANNG